MALSKYQQAVVDTLGKGQIVVESAPGSGKTRTVESLISEMILSGVNPSRIGAFTFSNKGASEMRWRVARTVFPNATQEELNFYADPFNKDAQEALGISDDPRSWITQDPRRSFIVDWICTIHALSFRLLKAFTNPAPRVLSGHWEREATDIIKDTIGELKYDADVKSVKYWIAQAITALVDPPHARDWFAEQLAERGADPTLHAGNLARCYRAYYDFCRRKGLVDFDMMQARVLWLLRNDNSFRQMAANMFDYIIVDEAQDTSEEQFEILAALIENTGNIVAVGDVDQSMYAFRGAQPEVLRSRFSARFPEVRRFSLPVNYRSVRSVINTSASLIALNYNGPSDPFLKAFASRDDAPDGDHLSYVHSATFSEMVSGIADTIEQGNPGDWFVLSRTRAECSAIHFGLLARGIKAVNKSGGLMMDADHIKKTIAYLKLACDYRGARNNTEILCEIANVATAGFRHPFTKRRHISGCKNDKSWVNCGCPIIHEQGVDYSHARYYGKEAVLKARNWAGIVAQQHDTNRGGFPSSSALGAQDLVGFVERLDDYKNDANKCLSVVIEDCMMPWLKAETGIGNDDPGENGIIEDFDVLKMLCEHGMTVEQYIDKLEGVASNNGSDDSDAVIIGTFHWSKGAERNKVVVNTTRCPIIPPILRKGQLPTTLPPTVEEERRLIYVGITRAKEHCTLVGASEWNAKEVPVSGFVRQLVASKMVLCSQDLYEIMEEQEETM